MGIRHLKNIILIGIGFMLNFTASGGLVSLQSSLNPIQGMGTTSLTVVYVSLIISSMILPPIMIRKLGCKWTLVSSMCCYITYTLANFYPQWYTLIPTSIIIGFGAGPLWASKCTYLTASGIRYAVKKEKDKTDVLGLYFGIFFLIHQSSGIWGNLFSSLIFSQKSTNVTALNSTFCGAGYCPVTFVNSPNSSITTNRPEVKLIYTLMGVYTACQVIAVILLAVFLEKIDLREGRDQNEEEPAIRTTLLATFRQMRDKRQLLLIPLTLFNGLQQGFLTSDYTQSYVTCSLGIHFVGYVMICFGAANCIFSMLSGKLSEYVGRIILFVLAAVTNLACIIGLLLWKPHSNQLAVYFIFAALWSLSDGIYQTLLNALYGVLFDENKEAAFSNFKIWESLGYVISYAYSAFLCTYIKLYIVLAVLVLGITCYGIVEFMEFMDSRKSSPRTTERQENSHNS